MIQIDYAPGTFAFLNKISPKPESQMLKGVVYRLIEYLASMGHRKLICTICVCNIFDCPCPSIKHPQHKWPWIRHCNLRSGSIYTPVSRDSDAFRRLVVKVSVLSDSFFLFIYFSYSHCTFEHYQASSRHLRG